MLYIRTSCCILERTRGVTCVLAWESLYISLGGKGDNVGTVLRDFIGERGVKCTPPAWPFGSKWTGEPTHGSGSDDASKGGADKRGIINRMTGDTNRRARFLNNDE